MQKTHADAVQESKPKATTGRRIASVIMGAASLGLFWFGITSMLDVADTYGDAFGGGWGMVWILVAGVATLLGAGAVALWMPPRSGFILKAFLWVAGAAIVVFGFVALVVAPV